MAYKEPPLSGGSSAALFSVYLSANQSNVTGDGTAYTIPFDFALLNVASCYNSGTGNFTAPSTGNYLFTSTVNIINIDATQTGAIFAFNGSVTQDRFFRGNPFVFSDVGGDIAVTGSIIIPMTAGDTMSVFAFVTGGAKTATVVGTSQPFTCFTGARL